MDGLPEMHILHKNIRLSKEVPNTPCAKFISLKRGIPPLFKGTVKLIIRFFKRTDIKTRTYYKKGTQFPTMSALFPEWGTQIPE